MKVVEIVIEDKVFYLMNNNIVMLEFDDEEPLINIDDDDFEDIDAVIEID